VGMLTRTDWAGVDLASIDVLYGDMRAQAGETVASVADQRFVDRTGTTLVQMWSDPELQREWLRELAAVSKEAAQLIRDGISKARIGNDALRSAWKWYEQEFDGDPIAWFAEVVGGAEALSGAEFDMVDSMLHATASALEDDQIAWAAQSFTQDAEYVADVEHRWNRFLADARSGAQMAVTALEITRDVSFTVATAIATGGTTGALGLTSTLGKAAVGAGMAMAGRGVEAMATGAGHILAGTTEDFDVTEELVAVVKSGAGGFAGTVVAGAAGKLTEKLAGRLAGALTPYLGERAAEWSTYLVRQTVDSAGESVVHTIAGLGIDAAAGRRFGSTDELLDYLIDEFVDNQWESMVGTIVGESAHHATPAIGAIDTDALQRAIGAAFR
jgi:hypothetical protein